MAHFTLDEIDPAFIAWHDAKWPEPESYPHKVAWREQRRQRLEAWNAALSALPAGGYPVTEWRWVDERGRAMTNWKQGDPPPIREVSDEKGTMRVEVRMTTPPPDAAVGAQGDGGPSKAEHDAALAQALREACAIYESQGRDIEHCDVCIGVLLDRTREILRISRLATPAAGKGVDDAMVERFKVLHDEGVRAYNAAETAAGRVPRLQAALDAGIKHALTRQPVAGDGWIKPSTRMPEERIRVFAYSDSPRWVGEVFFGLGHSRAERREEKLWRWSNADEAPFPYEVHGWQPLPAAPTDTPADGVEE